MLQLTVKKTANNFLLFAQLAAIFILACLAVFNFTQSKPTISTFHFFILVAQWVVITILFIAQNQNKMYTSFLKYLVQFAFLHLIFLFVPLWLFIIVALFILFTTYLNTQTTKIIFTKNNIQIALGFYKRTLLWQQINQVILKDGLLTIDCNNNTLLQKEIAENLNPKAEANFNSQIKSFYIN
jgi:hypothetical protein